MAAPDATLEAGIDAALLSDVDPYYGELQRGFGRTHVPPIGRTTPSTGFSTIEKMALGIRTGPRVVGKVVLTLKRAWTLKIAPLFVAPGFRGLGLGVAAVTQLTTCAQQLGLRQVFTTIPRTNVAARRVFERAGFQQTATLAAHYKPDLAEDVFVAWPTVPHDLYWPRPLTNASVSTGESVVADGVERTFFSVDQTWRSWLTCRCEVLGDFGGKPHEVVSDGGASALVIYKRGGTAKVVPVGPRVTGPCVTTWEAAARRRRRRKVSVFLPLGAGHPEALSGYKREAVAPTYSLYEAIAIYSRFL